MATKEAYKIDQIELINNAAINSYWMDVLVSSPVFKIHLHLWLLVPLQGVGKNISNKIAKLSMSVFRGGMRDLWVCLCICSGDGKETSPQCCVVYFVTCIVLVILSSHFFEHPQCLGLN